jgi:hypothetical protein
MDAAGFRFWHSQDLLCAGDAELSANEIAQREKGEPA